MKRHFYLPQVPEGKDEAAVEEYFYPEIDMPCVLDSPYCSYNRYSDPEPPSSAAEDRRRSNGQASTSGEDLP